MPGTISTALPSFSHDQHHKTDVAKRKGHLLKKKDHRCYSKKLRIKKYYKPYNWAKIDELA